MNSHVVIALIGAEEEPRRAQSLRQENFGIFFPHEMIIWLEGYLGV